MDNKNVTKTFMCIGIIYVTCLLLSNLVAGKMWAVSSNITLPAAVVLFPVTYIFGGYFYRSLRIQTRQNNYLAGIRMQLLRGSGIHADNSTSASGILAEPGGVCNSAWYDTESSACFFCGISVRRIFQFNDPLQT